MSTPTTPSSRSPLWVYGVLLVVLIIGIWPRAANLDGQILWIDEDLTYLAVEGVQLHGVPELPSGTVYSRGFLYTYIVALFTSIGGLDAVMMRLPSVIFSLALLYATFYLGREVGGYAVGLVAAGVLAVSPWDIHYARMARMYELLALIVVVIVYLGIRYQVRDVLRARVPLFLLLVVSLFVHRQAALLLPLFLVPAVMPDFRRGWGRVAVPIVAIVIGVLSITAVERWAEGHGPQPVFDTSETSGVSLPIVGSLDFNETRLWLGEAIAARPVVGILALMFGLVIAGVVAVRLRKTGSWPAAGAGFLAVVAMLGNQLALTVMLAALAMKCAAKSGANITRHHWMVIGGGLAATAVIVVVGLVAGVGPDALADRQLIRSWYSYPVPWPRLLLIQHPGLMAAIVFGSAWVFVRSLQSDSDQAPFYLVCSVWLPLFVMGMLPVHYFSHRYTYYLNALLVTLFALIVVDAVRLLHARLTTPSLRWAATAGVVAVAWALGSTQINPVEAYAMPRRSFGYNFEISRDLDVTASFHYDFTGAAQFVVNHIEPDDVVISRDPTNLYPYMRQLHYVMSGRYDGHAVTPAGEPVDWYLGIPYLPDVASLDQVLRENITHTRWIIYTRASKDGPNPFLTEDQLRYLERLDYRREYTSRDGLTVVLRLPPSTRTADDTSPDENIAG